MLSKSALFYRKNKKSRQKKKDYDAKLNRRPDQVKKRVALNRYNRLHNDLKGNKTDAYHKGNRIVGYKSEHENRGSSTDSKGDRNARRKKR